MAYNRYSTGRGKASWTPRPKPQQAEFVAPTFTPSVYQQNIVTALLETDQNLVIDAVAGSGKTSTLMLLVASILKLQRSYVVVAFNSSIKDELLRRGVNGRTFHSLGFSAVMTYCTAHNNGIRPEMDAQKVSAIVADTYPDAEGFSAALTKLVGLAKAHMLRPSCTDRDILYLVDHFDVEWEDENISDTEMCRMVRNVLTLNNADTRTIDFDDQLYFVWLFNLRTPTFDFILVDESQDTNPLRRDLIRRMMHATSRVVAVGDERQAIYGFTGASHDALDLIVRDFKCARFPLSVSYRCSRAVVAKAQTVVPHIQARENAPEGQVLNVATFKRSDFLPTDLLLCRNTAPLVATAYKMLASRIPCKILGREIGRSLTALIKKVSRKNETLESLVDRLLAHKASEIEKAMRQKKETKAQSVADKVDAILAILDSMTPEDTEQGIPGLIQIIEGMFTDQKNGCTTLATVHKAKGLEAPRVFILDPQLMPSKMARQEWQMIQEQNLMYVAITRALDTLVYVRTENLTD